MLLKKEKKFKEAKECFINAKLLDSSELKCYTNLVEIFIAEQKFTDGLEFFSKEINMCPYNHLAFMAKGIIYKYLKKNHEAIKCLRKAITLNSSNYVAHIQLASLYCDIKVSKHEASLNLLKVAIKLDKEKVWMEEALYYKSIVYFRLKKYKKSVLNLDKVIKLNKSNKLKAIFAKGHIHYMLKQTNSAIECYKKLKVIEDYSILINVIPILKLMSKKNYGDALIRLNACSDEKNNYFLNYLKGIIMNYLGVVDLAFFFFNKGRALQKEYGSDLDSDLILFHSYFTVYDQSLMDHCMQKIKSKKKKKKRFKLFKIY